jgi:Putative peptidoglycan binding domain/Transglycosylase SLT domain
MNKRLIGLTALTVGVIGYAIESAAGAAPSIQNAAPAAPVIGAGVPESSRGFSVTYVTEVQYVLKSFGYTIVVDGDYGTQTTGVVKSWQRSNGLDVDGVAGPVTRRSLGLNGNPPHSDTPKIATEPPSAPSGSVEDMIRAIWPDDLEDRALRIAYRESRYDPSVTSSTGCCRGVFQIHWPVHKSWLIEQGVTSPDQLFDAETNIRMAYVLYQRSGGWGPWSLTAY